MREILEEAVYPAKVLNSELPEKRSLTLPSANSSRQDACVVRLLGALNTAAAWRLTSITSRSTYMSLCWASASFCSCSASSSAATFSGRWRDAGPLLRTSPCYFSLIASDVYNLPCETLKWQVVAVCLSVFRRLKQQGTREQFSYNEVCRHRCHSGWTCTTGFRVGL